MPRHRFLLDEAASKLMGKSYREARINTTSALTQTRLFQLSSDQGAREMSEQMLLPHRRQRGLLPPTRQTGHTHTSHACAHSHISEEPNCLLNPEPSDFLV